MHEDVRETPPAEDEPTVCEAKEPEPAKKMRRSLSLR